MLARRTIFRGKNAFNRTRLIKIMGIIGIADVTFCWNEPRSRRARNPNKSRKIYILKSKFRMIFTDNLRTKKMKKMVFLLIYDSPH